MLHDQRMRVLAPADVRRAVRQALAEDVGPGDATTLATVPARTWARARMVARQPLVLAGLTFATTAFHLRSRRVVVTPCAADADAVKAGQVVLRIEGPARALLTAERVALNFVQRLSGVATLTARYVQAVHGTGVRILDTRKTTPGWRLFEKYAVACGGGQNHRFGLHDMVLVKDNHRVALPNGRPNPIAAAVRRARAAYPTLKVEVEADTIDQVRQAADAGADIILLDNMRVALLRQAVAAISDRSWTEASGGITLRTVRRIAASGVDFISVGALTHSAPAVDLALDFDLGGAGPR